MRRLARWLRRVVVATLLIACALWLTAYAREWLLRRRAERLLADIQALQVHQSTWADAQRLITRWGAWGTQYGSCTSARCDYQIWMSGHIPWEYRYPWELFLDPDGFHPLARLLDRTGVRQSVVYAGFSVSGGVITSKEFGVDMFRPVRLWYDTNDGVLRSELMASTKEGSHLRGELPDFYSGNIYSETTYGPRGNLDASSTPEEPLQHRQALMAYHLDCISRWSPCLRLEELLPQAVLEADANRRTMNVPAREGSDPELRTKSCDAGRLEFLAREEPEVWVASREVKSERIPDSPNPGKLQYRVFVSPLRLLKSRHHTRGEDFLRTYTVESQPTAVDDVRAPVLMFGDIEDYLPFPQPQSFGNRACSFTPVTPEALAAVQKGIHEDLTYSGH